MSLPNVTVIVPHYHDMVGLDRCLSALSRQTYPADRTQIVVSDNASPEGEAAIAGMIKARAQLVNVEQRGAAPTRNGGVAIATGDILAFTDSDCAPEPDWIAAGVAALQHYDVVGGRMTVSVEDERRMTSVEAFERVFAFDNESYVKRKGFSVTANLFCRRADFARVGGFRDGLSEDLDWCHRATAAGLRLGYAPAAVVGHPARRTWDELTRKLARLTAETYGLLDPGRAARLRWLLRSCALPGSAVVHSYRVFSSPNLQRPVDRFAALAVLFRSRLWRFRRSIGLLLRSAS
jgi:GT2 family glycosyltransferase